MADLDDMEEIAGLHVEVPRKRRPRTPQTACKRGHPLTAANTHTFYQNGYRHRICKECARLRYRASRKIRASLTSTHTTTQGE